MTRWVPRFATSAIEFAATLVKTTVVAAAVSAVAMSGIVYAVPAAAADAAAQFALAARYENAEGLPRDFGQALSLYCDAAQQGHADAAVSIAWMYLNGRGVGRDEAIAAAWLRLAAERGNPLALRLLDRVGAVAMVKASGCPEPESAIAAIRPGAVIAPPAEIVKLVAQTAALNKIDPKLVLAVIATESAFQTDAVSPRNARGLMQLMPETAERFGVKNVFDPGENIRGGVKYLRWLLTYFEDDLSLALAAYNAGEGAVTRYGGIPPFPETRAYVDKIRALYALGKRPGEHLALR
jgi:hypothetical protein